MTLRQIGRYAVMAPIASGGMATVYFGRLVGPAGFSRIVAVKQLRRDVEDRSEFARLLVQEARLAARVKHTNVVQTLEVIATSTDHAIVMEYVHGESLAALVSAAKRAKTDVSIAIAVSVVIGVLYGLHAAHEACGTDGAPLGIVHRDVSPQNILVGVDGVARVLDFGIAKTPEVTTKRQGWGKLAYMAPEQLHLLRVDRRTDVYAAGVILWEVLTGRSLFGAEGPATTVAKVLTAFVEAPSALRAEVPVELDAIVNRALMRDPDKRFSSAREMALALEGSVRVALPSEVATWVSDIAAEPLEARMANLRELETISTEAQDAAEGETLPAPATLDRSGQRGKVGAALLVMVLVVVAALGVRQSGLGKSSSSSPPASVSSSEGPAVPFDEEPSDATSEHTPAPLTPTGPNQGPARRRPLPSKHRSSKADCDAPFFLDAQGHKHFKKECFPH